MSGGSLSPRKYNEKETILFEFIIWRGYKFNFHFQHGLNMSREVMLLSTILTAYYTCPRAIFSVVLDSLISLREINNLFVPVQTTIRKGNGFDA